MKKVNVLAMGGLLAAAAIVITSLNSAGRSEPPGLPDFIVKPKPPEHELVVFIHYPKAKPSDRGGGKALCPNKTIGKWATKNLSFSVNPNGTVTKADGMPLSASEISTAVAAGFNPWEVVSGLTSPNVGATSNLPSSYVDETRNSVNEIAWASLSAKGFQNAIAVTYVWRIRATKEIVEADMVNNSDPGFGWVRHDVLGDPNTAVVPTTEKFDLPNIDTHEFGHFVGLDHVSETEHTMFNFSSTDEVKKQSLECGDKAGVQKLYGQ